MDLKTEDSWAWLKYRDLEGDKEFINGGPGASLKHKFCKKAYMLLCAGSVRKRRR